MTQCIQRPPLLKISSAFHHCLGYVPFLSLWLAAHTPCAVHYILGALFEEAFSAALHKHCHSAARLALASSTTLLRSAHRILVEKPCLVVRVVQEGTGRARRRCRRCRAGWGCRGRRGLWRWHRRGLARRRALPVNHPVASFQIPRDVRSRGKSSHKQPRPVGSGSIRCRPERRSLYVCSTYIAIPPDEISSACTRRIGMRLTNRVGGVGKQLAVRAF